MFNLTDLLDQLGAHFPLVVIACIELLAAALLVARAVRSEDNRPVGGCRSAVGKAGENGAEMLRALNFRRFEANLLLRRADMMPLYAVGDLAGLLGLPLESLQEDLAVVLPQGELSQIRNLREDTEQGVWELCYGEDTLPAGDLYGADMLLESDEDMLTVTTEQEKALYLRAFTAGVLNHTYGGWDVLPDSAYSGEYAGLLDWLDSKGFDPFTQVAQYYALGSFLWKLIRSRPKHTLLQNLKRRYRRI